MEIKYKDIRTKTYNTVCSNNKYENNPNVHYWEKLYNEAKNAKNDVCLF